MMDSQENTLVQGAMAEEQQDAVAAETNDCECGNTETDNQNGTAARPNYKTKKEVLERTRQLAHSDEVPAKDEVDFLKTTFYKIHVAERDEAQRKYLENGGDPEKFQLLPDEDEKAFKVEMSVIREKRAKVFMQQEAEKQENLKRKLEIIEKIKAMATSPDEANKSYQDFKALQQEWKEIKAVPA